MAIYNNLYSKRNKQTPDVFTYDVIPNKLKIQITRNWEKLHNNVDPNWEYEFYNEFDKVKEILCDEYGKKQLVQKTSSRWLHRDSYDEVLAFFEHSRILDECLDVIELVTSVTLENSKFFKCDPFKYTPLEALEDLNARFLENGIGFEYREGEIIRIDNKLLHIEIIIPALHFLSAPEFQNANDEYLLAHEHFRHSRTKDCLNNCLKAFESTLKIICSQNDWKSDKGETAKPLLDLCFQNNLIPSYLANHFNGIRSSLESGVPTLRNKLGGHGQGPQKIEVPMHYASYMLYLTGTTINFLVSCQQELKP